MRIRAWAEVADHWTITDPRAVDALSPFYVWTTDYAEKRLAWKRRHPLHVVLLRTYRIPRPVTVKVRDEFGGCRSWLEITRDLPFEGTPGARRTTSSSAPPRKSPAIVAGDARRSSSDPRRATARRGRFSMAWVETVTPSFRARHESADADDVARALDSLEATRARLEIVFPRTAADVTVVFHRSSRAARPRAPARARSSGC